MFQVKNEMKSAQMIQAKEKAKAKVHDFGIKLMKMFRKSNSIDASSSIFFFFNLFHFIVKHPN